VTQPKQGRPDSMDAPREHKGLPIRPASRAQRRNSVPRGTPVRAGRAAIGPSNRDPSTRNALLWAVVVGAVLVWMLRDLVLLVGYSVLLAYALLPVVAAIERPRGRRGPHVPRGVSAAAVMLGLVAVVSWLLALAAPILAAQAAGVRVREAQIVTVRVRIEAAAPELTPTPRSRRK